MYTSFWSVQRVLVFSSNSISNHFPEEGGGDVWVAAAGVGPAGLGARVPVGHRWSVCHQRASGWTDQRISRVAWEPGREQKVCQLATGGTMRSKPTIGKIVGSGSHPRDVRVCTCVCTCVYVPTSSTDPAGSPPSPLNA